MHRVDEGCEHTDFTAPPFDIHIRFLPSVSGGWTMLGHASAGRPDALAVWLRGQRGILDVRVPPGIAPKFVRARVAHLPPVWAQVASMVRVHHLDLSRDGSASWFVEGTRETIASLVELMRLPGGPDSVRSRPVRSATEMVLSRRQFEALASAVALGYYEIPHRLDLRAMAARSGISLGSISELLRRGEGAVLTHYVDDILLRLPDIVEEELPTMRSLVPN